LFAPNYANGDVMRVYISIDMEGVAGVVHEDQTDPIEPRHVGEYNRFRRLMTNEANAAIAGALEAGATGVVVNDSHWLMRNLLAEELNPVAELLSGSPKRLSMVEGIDGGFDAAMFVGYHARAGTRGGLPANPGRRSSRPPAEARAVYLPGTDPAGGRFRGEPDGGHGGAGAGEQSDWRTDGQLYC
jgi:hypothetical protein